MWRDPFETDPDASPMNEHILFYIDPLNGQMYSHLDIGELLQKDVKPPVPTYFKPLSNKRIIQFLLEELNKCFDNVNNQYKMDELLQLASLLDDESER